MCWEEACVCVCVCVRTYIPTRVQTTECSMLYIGLCVQGSATVERTYYFNAY